MASETQSNEPETQLVEDEAPLELKDGLGKSLIPEQDVCVADKQEDGPLVQGRSEDYPFRGVQDNFLPTKGRG
jgi:hypothetical protein